MPSILRNNRFNRRDANRTLDDDEELWFEQEDDIAENEDIMPMSDMLKTDMLKSSKIDEFDAFSMKYQSKKGKGSCLSHINMHIEKVHFDDLDVLDTLKLL